MTSSKVSASNLVLVRNSVLHCTRLELNRLNRELNRASQLAIHDLFRCRAVNQYAIKANSLTISCRYTVSCRSTVSICYKVPASFRFMLESPMVGGSSSHCMYCSAAAAAWQCCIGGSAVALQWQGQAESSTAAAAIRHPHTFVHVHWRPPTNLPAPHGGDSAGLTCLLCKQAILVRTHPPHAKGPKETKITCLHDRKLVFWTKSSWSCMSVKKKTPPAPDYAC